MMRGVLVSLVVISATPAFADAADSARAAIKKKLVNPNSARFTEVVEKSEAVCGLVDATNRLGIYAGPHQFYFLLKTGRGLIEQGTDISTDDADAFAFGYPRFCS